MPQFGGPNRVEPRLSSRPGHRYRRFREVGSPDDTTLNNDLNKRLRECRLDVFGGCSFRQSYLTSGLASGWSQQLHPVNRFGV
jgi:hypothetical protein